MAGGINDKKIMWLKVGKPSMYYNQKTKPLPELQYGQTVHMKLPNDDKWSLGTCKGEIVLRSYLADYVSRTYH